MENNKGEFSTSYAQMHSNDLKKAKELYVKTKKVEYSCQDHYVTVGGVVINGINKQQMQQIIKEVEVKKMRHNLKVFRVTHNLTQQQLADKLGVSVSTYNLIENGSRRGSQKLWETLQKEFNLDGGKVWELQRII